MLDFSRMDAHTLYDLKGVQVYF